MSKVKLGQSQKGEVSALLISLIVSIVFLVGVGVFAVWAFMSRNDYKTNVDAKIATAVEIANKETTTELENKFIEENKKPLKEYKSPDQFGSLSMYFPKTWSAYVDENNNNGTLSGYFNPKFVPAINTQTSYALRLEVVDRKFSDEIKGFDSQIKTGKVTARPFQFAKMPNTVGLRVDGNITGQKQGIIILMPLREKTIKLSTESDQFKADFENHILPNFTFSP